MNFGGLIPSSFTKGVLVGIMAYPLSAAEDAEERAREKVSHKDEGDVLNDTASSSAIEVVGDGSSMISREAFNDMQRALLSRAKSAEAKRDELRLELNEKESELKEKESELKGKESELKGKESELKEKESELKEKESKLKEKEYELKEKESKLKEEVLREELISSLEEENAELKRAQGERDDALEFARDDVTSTE